MEKFAFQKNGDIYVYEQITAYDPVTKKTVAQQKTLKGKILAGTDVLVPTRPKRTSIRNKSSNKPTSRTRLGLSDLLNWISVESDISAALNACFPLGEAAKIETIARYWFTTDRQALSRLENW